GDGVLATSKNGNIVFCQIVPWQFDPTKQSNLKRTYRRASFAVSRLLANLGVPSTSPILARFSTPVESSKRRNGTTPIASSAGRPTHLTSPANTTSRKRRRDLKRSRSG